MHDDHPPEALAKKWPRRIHISGDREMIPFGAFLLSSHLLVAVADVVPNVDFKKTCNETANVIVGLNSQNDLSGCLSDEQDAHNLLVKQWSQFAPIDKQRCVRTSSGYLPSYVELLTCLEMAKEARTLPSDQTMGAGNPAQ
jgi:hypothetical protein